MKFYIEVAAATATVLALALAVPSSAADDIADYATGKIYERPTTEFCPKSIHIR